MANNTYDTPTLDCIWPCKRGDTGGHVKTLQSILKYKFNLYIGDIDGSFGEMTEDAVKKYQKNDKMYVDGFCGGKTWYSIITKSATNNRE